MALHDAGAKQVLAVNLCVWCSLLHVVFSGHFRACSIVSVFPPQPFCRNTHGCGRLGHQNRHNLFTASYSPHTCSHSEDPMRTMAMSISGHVC